MSAKMNKHTTSDSMIIHNSYGYWSRVERERNMRNQIILCIYIHIYTWDVSLMPSRDNILYACTCLQYSPINMARQVVTFAKSPWAAASWPSAWTDCSAAARCTCCSSEAWPVSSKASDEWKDGTWWENDRKCIYSNNVQMISNNIQIIFKCTKMMIYDAPFLEMLHRE